MLVVNRVYRLRKDPLTLIVQMLQMEMGLMSPLLKLKRTREDIPIFV